MTHKTPIYLSVYIILLILLTGCARHAPWYEGHYFDAKINGLEIVPIKHKRKLASLQGFPRYRNVKWMVKGKAEGDLDVIVYDNKISPQFIGQVGDNDSAEVYIFALDGQCLESEREWTRSTSVTMEGSALVKEDDVLTSDYMPPGAYVISIKTEGPDNWDRKYVYVEFK